MSTLALEPVLGGAPVTRRHGHRAEVAIPRALSSSPVRRDEFIDVMSAAATGVNVVTTDGTAGRFGLTVSAMSSVSADPPTVLACVNRRSPACAAVRINAAFCVNVLSTRQRNLADTFAGRPEFGIPFEFKAAAWTTGSRGLPCLVGAVSTFECALETAIDSGSHTVFIGRVITASKGDGEPLLYATRTYRRLCRQD